MISSYKKISKDLNRNGLLRNVISYFPFLYVCLVIYGFVSKSSFFYIIDVDITQYVSIGELLFPAITAIELTYVVLAFVFMILIFKMVSGKKNKAVKTNDKSNSFKPKNAPKWIETSISVIVPLLLLFPAILVFTVFFSNHQFLKSTVFQVFTVLFGVLILITILTFNSKLKVRTIQNLIAVLILYFLVCTVYYQIIEGNSILQGSPEYLVEFTNNNTHIKSSDSLIYFGKTNSYLFMRDLASEKTKVFNLNFIPTITFQKVRESNFDQRIRANKRDWSEHPIYKIVNTQTSIHENVIKVERRAEIFIVNDKYLFVKRVKVHTKDKIPTWIQTDNDEHLLYSVEPPYMLIKEKNDYKAFIIKDSDTLIVTNRR